MHIGIITPMKYPGNHYGYVVMRDICIHNMSIGHKVIWIHTDNQIQQSCLLQNDLEASANLQWMCVPYDIFSSVDRFCNIVGDSPIEWLFSIDSTNHCTSIIAQTVGLPHTVIWHNAGLYYSTEEHNYIDRCCTVSLYVDDSLNQPCLPIIMFPSKSPSVCDSDKTITRILLILDCTRNDIVFIRNLLEYFDDSTILIIYESHDCPFSFKTDILTSFNRRQLRRITQITYQTLSYIVLQKISCVVSRRRWKCVLFNTCAYFGLLCVHKHGIDPTECQTNIKNATPYILKQIDWQNVTPTTSLPLTYQIRVDLFMIQEMADAITFSTASFHVVVLLDISPMQGKASVFKNQILKVKTIRFVTSGWTPPDMQDILPDDYVLYVRQSWLLHAHATSRVVTLLFALCFELYQCDAVFWHTDTENTEVYFSDGFLPLSLPDCFSSKYRFMGQMDDISGWNNLYVCTIHVNGSKKKTFTTHYVNVSSSLTIPSFVPPRTLLSHVEDTRVVIKKCWQYDHHVSLHFFSKEILMLTWTRFTPSQKPFFTVEIQTGTRNIPILLVASHSSHKVTRFIYVNQEDVTFQKRLAPETRPQVVVQTHETAASSLLRFYSVCTVMSAYPEMPYVFCNAKDRSNFIHTFFPTLLPVYNKLLVHSYEADMFRALYLYKNGGIYIDCKMIIFHDIHTHSRDGLCFIRDQGEKRVCNGYMYVTGRQHPFMLSYVKDMVNNIIEEEYGESDLAITGPRLLFNHIPQEYVRLKNNGRNNDLRLSYGIDEEENIICNFSYHSYYEENNYLTTAHYSIAYRQRDVFDTSVRVEPSDISFDIFTSV